MRRRRIGIVGCGAVVEFFYCRYLPGVQGAFVAGVCDRNPVQAERVADKLCCPSFDFNELLDKVDLLIVATPPESHYSLGKAALKRGVDVWMEKPFATSAAEADELVALARAAGRALHVAHFRRYFPPLILTRNIVQTGILGHIEQIEMHEGGRFQWITVSDYIRTNRNGGVLWDTGSHTLDMGLYASCLDGEKISIVVKSVDRDQPEPSHELAARFSLHSDKGEIACVLQLSRRNLLANRVRLRGQHGWIEFSVAPGGGVRIGKGTISALLKGRDETVGAGQCFREQCQEILSQEKARDRLAGEKFLNQMRIIESVLSYA